MQFVIVNDGKQRKEAIVTELKTSHVLHEQCVRSEIISRRSRGPLLATCAEEVTRALGRGRRKYSDVCLMRNMST